MGDFTDMLGKKPKPLIDLNKAEKDVADMIDAIDRALQSALTPKEQMFALNLARCQLLGSYAMIKMCNGGGDG